MTSQIGEDESTQLFLFRHGETEWSALGKHTGTTDIPLTDRGRQQARQLGERVRDLQFDMVLCSPRQRAIETARLAGFPDATICDALAEVNYGDYEGLTLQEIRERDRDWTVWSGRLPEGEPLDDAAERAQQVMTTALEHSGNVAIFSHGHFLRILALTWLGLPPQDGRLLMLDPATLSCLSHEHGQRAMRIWNSHG